MQKKKIILYLTDEATRGVYWRSRIDHVGSRSKELISNRDDGRTKSGRSEVYK